LDYNAALFFTNAVACYLFFAFGSYGASLDGRGTTGGEKAVLASFFLLATLNAAAVVLG